MYSFLQRSVDAGNELKEKTEAKLNYEEFARFPFKRKHVGKFERTKK